MTYSVVIYKNFVSSMGINGRNALCDDLDQTASNTYINIKIRVLK